jgi:hypothetical protein
VKLSSLNSISPRLKKLARWIVAVFLFYTVFGFFILPHIVRLIAVKQLSTHLDRPVTIQKVRLNPYSLSATVRGFLIKDKDGEAMVSWDEAYVNFQLISLLSDAWAFKEVSLSQPFVRIRINKDYTLNFSDIVSRLSPTLPSKSRQAGKHRSWHVNRLRLTGGKVSFTDLTPRMPFRRTVGPLELTLTNFQTDSAHQNAFALSGSSDGGESFSWNGSFFLDPLRSEGEVSLDGLALTTYTPLYQDLFRFEIKDGVISLRSSYRYERSAATNLLTVTNTTFALKSLEMVEKDTGQPAVKVSNFGVTGASVDALARQAEADTMTVTGGRFVLRRNKDTSVNAVELLKPAVSAPPAPGGILLLLRAMTNLVALLLNTTNLANGVIRDLNFTNCALHLEDLVNSQPVRLDLEDIAIHGKNISNRAGTNMTAGASLRWDTNGTARASLRAALSLPNAEVELALDKLNLQPLAPYLEPYLDIFVLGSKLGLAGTVRLRSTKGELPEVRFQGDAWLDGFSLAEGTATEGLLQWNSLQLAGIEANLNPAVVSVTKARLDDVFAQLIIETNRAINLMSALRRGGTNAAAALASTNTIPAVRPRISLASLVLSNANIHFIDRSLHPNVNILLEKLNGTLSSISSEAPQPADVHLQGTVDKTARAEITGKINPWDSKQPLDLKVSLQGMDLRPEDPYSGKYLGYRLKKGELSAQLSYRVAERKLKSENRLTVDQLTLGPKVESADATTLPVRLAIALLKDRDGRIVLDLPVSGSLDDPQFNLGGVVYRAIETVLVKIVKSPFAALGALFGGKGEELSFQEFQPGSTNLLPAAVAKLDILVKGLYERPELQLEVEGSADPVSDLAALRLEKLHQQMPVQKSNALLFIAGTNNATTARPTVQSFRKAFSDEKGAVALRSPVPFWSPVTVRSKSSETNLSSHPIRLLADEKGATALMRIFAPEGAAGDPGSEPQSLEGVELPPDALATLASERAGNVRAYLIQKGRIQPQRITESARGSGSKGSRVYLWLQ